MGRFLKTATKGVGALVFFVTTGCVSAQDLTTKDVPLTEKTVSVGGAPFQLGQAAGYCIRDRQSRYTAAGAFVVMGPCDPKSETAPKGLVVVNVLAESPIGVELDADKMDRYFKSDAGRMALSSKGKGAGVEVLGTMEADGLYVVHSRDAAGPVIPDTSPEQWRSFFVAGDRLVSLTVVNFIDNPMTDGQIFLQMEEISLKIKALN